jgi:hypothetical protein
MHTAQTIQLPIPTQAAMPAVSMLSRKKMRYVKMPRYRQMSQAERKGMLREEMSLEKLYSFRI